MLRLIIMCWLLGMYLIVLLFVYANYKTLGLLGFPIIALITAWLLWYVDDLVNW